MTDPRIEAAARCLFGDKVDQSSGAREYLLGEVEKALAAADAAAWRPIESVPRDGTRVIAYRPEAPATQANVFEIVAGDNRATKSPQGVTHYTNGWCHPTHWQPLPAPPGDEVKA